MTTSTSSCRGTHGPGAVLPPRGTLRRGATPYAVRRCARHRTVTAWRRAGAGRAVRGGGVRAVGAVPAVLAAAGAERLARGARPPGALVARRRRGAARDLRRGAARARGGARPAGRCCAWRSPRSPSRVNWGAYIYGVTSGQVVETSLGYFINPLVTVLLGVFVLGERLRPVQWGALALAGARGRRAERRGRPAAVPRPAAGVLLRRVRPAEEDRAGGAGGGAGHRDGGARAGGGGVPVVLGAPGGSTFGGHGPGHARAAGAVRRSSPPCRCCCSARRRSGCRW